MMLSEARGLKRGLSKHFVVLYKVKLVESWMKKREEANESKIIKNERLIDHQ